MKKQWFKDSVVYQIYPMSFQDSNNDGIGDIAGITQRLDYIKRLGVDVIWLNPIYTSPNQDNGYDIADYQNINPEYGNMNDFDLLLEKVHQSDMKLIMDLVVNHTSSEHEWFQQSKRSIDNKFADFYIWRNPVDGHEPNNWLAAFGGPAWTYVPERGQYYLHMFAPGQPDLNWENPEVRQAVFGVERFWLDKGVDGFRMDVINLISKPQGLPDLEGIPTSERTMEFIAGGKRLNEYLKQMNDEVLSHYDVMTVGEMPGATPEKAIEYTGLNNNELNMVFQFEHVGLSPNPNLRLGKWNDEKVKLTELKSSLSRWQESLDGQGWNSLYWNNHDQPRAVSRFGNDSPKYRELSAKMLATTLHMLQGTPYIYEGEELGMTNGHFTSLDQYEDLESINFYHELVDEKQLIDSATMLNYMSVKSRDNARTPMQWNNEKNSGFTEGNPWYELNKNYTEVNALNNLERTDSVFYHYQKLIKLRHELEIIRYGDFESIDSNDDQVYAYRRNYKKQSLFIISNFTENKIMRFYNEIEKGKLIISNYLDDAESEIRPYESKVYLIEK